MPSGYAGEGKHYSQKLGRWLSKEKTKAFDYDEINQQSFVLLVSFYRYYPDYFADLYLADDAVYSLAIPQRMMLRIDARYEDTYITGVRGLTKTYTKLLGKMIKGILYPGIVMRYSAADQKQAASLARQAFRAIEKDYPYIASHWKLNNDRDDMFRISTSYGSEFTMYSPRGDNCHEVIAEEIGSEDGKNSFDIEKFEKSVRPTCRLDRRINRKLDRCMPQQQHTYISNACSRTNRAYTVHREETLNKMESGGEYAGYVIDIPWQVALLAEIRSIKYIEDQKAILSPNDFLREMCAIYTGTGENPLIDDETLTRSRSLLIMEDAHCGNPNVIYIVAHDVSYAGGNRNAECADMVVKLSEYEDLERRDIYRKQAVYANSYQPPSTYYEQAMRVKALWIKYCLNGGQTTYIVIDANSNGDVVIQELMKPTADGTPPLCSINHDFHPELEQPGALPVIYPMKAGTRGTKDEDGAMIQYAQSAFTHGNVELLTSNALDGIEAYKTHHNVKEAFADRAIILPYHKTDLLCQEIANLKAETSGMTLKERRKSTYIQRDLWSALKYALRMAQLLEDILKTENYHAKSSWSDKISAYKQNGVIGVCVGTNRTTVNNERSRLLTMRRR